jgi:hypothetical protein
VLSIIVISVAIGVRRLMSVGVAQCLPTLAPTSPVGLTLSCVSSLGLPGWSPLAWPHSMNVRYRRS